jgi:hypothetical protein
MNDHPAHKDDVVRVHPGVKIGDHDLSNVYLTVHATHEGRYTAALELDDHFGRLELTQTTGGRHYFLLPQDVDVITRLRVAR